MKNVEVYDTEGKICSYWNKVLPITVSLNFSNIQNVNIFIFFFTHLEWEKKSRYWNPPTMIELFLFIPPASFDIPYSFQFD